MIQAPPAHLQHAVERRSISCSFSHLWSDALFSRQRAIEVHARARSIAAFLERPENDQVDARRGLGEERACLLQCKWDCGTFTRWTVITAWMAFERACSNAVRAPKLGHSFNKGLDEALEALGAEPVNRGEKLWQQVERVRQLRILYVHKDCEPEELAHDADIAKFAIATLRKALIDLHLRVGTPHPAWIECDDVPMPLGGSSCWPTVVHPGTDDDPEAIRIVAVYGGEERENSRMRHDHDPWPEVERLVNSVRVPITAVRLYSGERLEFEIAVRLRGSADPAP
jgi:hypothetical protein